MRGVATSATRACPVDRRRDAKPDRAPAGLDGGGSRQAGRTGPALRSGAVRPRPALPAAAASPVPAACREPPGLLRGRPPGPARLTRRLTRCRAGREPPRNEPPGSTGRPSSPLVLFRGPGILSLGPGDPSSPSRPSACPAAVTAVPHRCSIDVVRATAMLHRCGWQRPAGGWILPVTGPVIRRRDQGVSCRISGAGPWRSRRRPAARVRCLPARHAQHRPMLLQQAQAGPRRGHPP